MNRFASRLATGVLVAVSFLACTDRASAAERAFSSRGTAQFTGPTTFVGVGNATHLGSYTETGTLAFTPTGNPAVLHVEGAIIYTAADGSELHATVAGELNGATGAVSGTLTYGGGTGRFATASGSSSLVGQAFPDGSMAVSVGGTIDY